MGEIMKGRIGAISAADGAQEPLRMEERGGLVTAGLSGRYRESVSKGNVYIAANQTGCVWSVGLHTTNTGLCLSNPNGSGKVLSLLWVSHQEVVAPGGIAAVYLAGGYSATAVTHSVAGTILKAKIGARAAQSVANFDTGATLPVAPAILLNLTAGHTSAGLSTAANIAALDLGGIIEIEPGGFVIVANFTVGVAVGQKAAIIWEEIDE
jgi:hypothetical protein